MQHSELEYKQNISILWRSPVSVGSVLCKNGHGPRKGGLEFLLFKKCPNQDSFLKDFAYFPYPSVNNLNECILQFHSKNSQASFIYVRFLAFEHVDVRFEPL